jgi:hypothetical protein
MRGLDEGGVSGVTSSHDFPLASSLRPVGNRTELTVSLSPVFRCPLSVYGYTMLIGSIIGCCAGVPGADGYALFLISRFIIGLGKRFLQSDHLKREYLQLIKTISILPGLASFLMTSLVVVQEITHPRSRAAIAASWVGCLSWRPTSLDLPADLVSSRLPSPGLLLHHRDRHCFVHRLRNELHDLVLVLATPLHHSSPALPLRKPHLYSKAHVLLRDLNLTRQALSQVLIGVQFVPETPRYLFDKGRHDEALQFFIEYHGNGDPNDPLVHFEFAEMKEALSLEKEIGAAKWRTIVKSKGSLHRFGLAALMAFMTGVRLAAPTSSYYFDLD